MIAPAQQPRPAETDDNDQDANDAAVDAALKLKRGHPYQRFAANPAQAAPHIGFLHRHLLTSSASRRGAGTGDLRSPAMRPGATEATQYPSRTGDRLRWPDGRVTTLDGEVVIPVNVEPAPETTAPRPRRTKKATTHGGVA